MTATSLVSRWRAEGREGEVLRVALPLILSSSSWTIQHFLDRVFLTWYSPQAIAAAMPAGILLFTFICFFIGVANYVNTFVAQYVGAGRPQRVGAAIWQGVYFSLPAGVILLCLMPFAGQIFSLIGHAPEVQAEEVTYFRILCLSAWPTVLSTALACYFTGRGKTWPVMWVSAIVTAFHVLLDYLWIFGHWGFPRMGIAGAAWASVVCDFLIAVAYAILLLRREPRHKFGLLRGWRPDWELFKRLLRYGAPNGVQFMLDLACFTAFLLLVGKLGEKELAATNVAFSINTLAFMPMIGIGTAVSTLVGQRLGHNRPDIAERTTWTALRLTFLYMGLIAVAYVACPWVFVYLFAAGNHTAALQDILPVTIVLLRFVALYSLFDSLNIVMASAVKGAGDTRFVMYATVILGWMLMVVPTYFACIHGGAGLYWAWGFATIYVICLGLMFLLRFMGGKWKHMRVIEAVPAPVPPPLPDVPVAEV
jgi:MATE family multidrug resistance protein